MRKENTKNNRKIPENFRNIEIWKKNSKNSRKNLGKIWTIEIITTFQIFFQNFFFRFRNRKKNFLNPKPAANGKKASGTHLSGKWGKIKIIYESCSSVTMPFVMLQMFVEMGSGSTDKQFGNGILIGRSDVHFLIFLFHRNFMRKITTDKW